MESMKVDQGTDEWLELRRNYFTASEAPVMMGVSPWKTRNQLLDQKKGLPEPEVSEALKKIFQRGHDAENAIRPLIEEARFDLLPPLTGTINVEGLPLLASFDGVGGNIVFEHKLLNETLAQNIRNGVISPLYYWQLEQQMLVAGISVALFVASDGTMENMVSMIYRSQSERREALIAGWHQFKKDLASHEVVAKAEPIIAVEQETLPQIYANVNGSAVQTNAQAVLVKIKELASSELGRPLNCDQDFADKIALVKMVGKQEDAVNAQILAIQNGQGEITDFINTAKEVSALLRKIRLDGASSIKTEKERKKTDIINKATVDLMVHASVWNKLLAPSSVGDFIREPFDLRAVIHGKSNLDSIMAAVDSAVAARKIEFDTKLTKIVANIKIMRAPGERLGFLFGDWMELVFFDPEAVEAITKSRVAEHIAAEKKRLDVEREQMRIEEEKKAQDKAESERQKEPATIIKPDTTSTTDLDPWKRELRQIDTELGDELTKRKNLPKDGSEITVLVPTVIHWETYLPKSIQARKGVNGRWVDMDGLKFPFDPEDLV